jgi:phosphate starvation-inducible PhoH-like protein
MSKGAEQKSVTVSLQFEDNALLPQLFGQHNGHLDTLERLLGISVRARGNQLNLTGEESLVDGAVQVLTALYKKLENGLALETAEIEAAFRMAADHESRSVHDFEGKAFGIKTQKRFITPRTATQTVYLQTLKTHDLVFGVGPAGTGKTYLAVAKGVELLMSGAVDRIVLSRPAVEAGERLGFLPGDLKEKIDPYLRPLYDALHDMLPAETVVRKLESGTIEIAPLAFMRGRTLANSFVILDEAQNATPVQMKMFLTRLGESSRMVVTGDPSQVDLPSNTLSGMIEALRVLKGISEIGFVEFNEKDVVRHPLVAKIAAAYADA